MIDFDLEQALAGLGITPAMRAACLTPPCDEAVALIDAGPDMFGRPQQMTPETRAAWCAMRDAARADGIELLLVSAYRSTEYQCEVIRRKLDAGRTLDDILAVNAMPGHSEHHSGRALDLHAGNGEPLTEAFEQEPAFDWLIGLSGSS